MALFVTIEGIEGVGKSTCLETVRQFLSDQHCSAVFTREPGGTEIAEAIRHLLLHELTEEIMSDDTELLLVFASRAQHIAKVIKPQLAKGNWVVCDRFTDASFAYQGAGRGIPAQRVAMLEQFVHPDLQPNLTLLLDAPVDIAMARADKRGELDRIETESFHFFERVRQCYLGRAQQFPDRFVVIDASQPLEVVNELVIAALKTAQQR